MRQKSLVTCLFPGMALLVETPEVRAEGLLQAALHRAALPNEWQKNTVAFGFLGPLCHAAQRRAPRPQPQLEWRRTHGADST